MAKNVNGACGEVDFRLSGGEITRVQGAYASWEEIDDIVGILKSEKR